MTVPQVGHLPLMALRPFFITSSTASMISFFALHLTQYPSGIKIFLPRSFMPRSSYSHSLLAGYPYRQQRKEWDKYGECGKDYPGRVTLQVIYNQMFM